MATKKPTTKKSTTSRAAAAKSTAKVTKKETVVKQVPTRVTTTVVKEKKLPNNLANIVFAEIVGTFILALVAAFSASTSGVLYVGLALIAIVTMIGTISGAHVNPIVTLGLWITRKTSGRLVPFYLAAQFIGAMLAVAVSVAILGTGYPVNLFGGVANLSWGIVALEALGAALFVFGVVAVVSRDELTNGAKAVGIGLSLFVALTISSGMLPAFQQTVAQSYQKAALKYQEEAAAGKAVGEKPTLPREILVKGTVVNPAIALMVSDYTRAQLMGSNSNAPVNSDEETPPSRFGLETVLGALFGTVVGAGLYLLVTYKPRQ